MTMPVVGRPNNGVTAARGQGLPLGLQVIGYADNDAGLFEIATALRDLLRVPVLD